MRAAASCRPGPWDSVWERMGWQGGLHSLPHSWCLQEEVIWGASSCPCVESVQGSALMPVHVEREVQLLGRNLHLFQVSVSCLQASSWPPWLLANHIQARGSRKRAPGLRPNPGPSS